MEASKSTSPTNPGDKTGRMVTVEIRGATRPPAALEIKPLTGERVYRRGTDPYDFVDCHDRAGADLLVVNLNLIPGVRARICGE